MIAFNLQPGGKSVTVVVEKMGNEYVFSAALTDERGISIVATQYTVTPSRLARWHARIPASLGVDVLEVEATRCARIAAKCNAYHFSYFHSMISSRWAGTVHDMPDSYRQHVHHLQNVGEVGSGRRTNEIAAEWLR